MGNGLCFHTRCVGTRVGDSPRFLRLLIMPYCFRFGNHYYCLGFRLHEQALGILHVSRAFHSM